MMKVGDVYKILWQGRPSIILKVESHQREFEVDDFVTNTRTTYKTY